MRSIVLPLLLAAVAGQSFADVGEIYTPLGVAPEGVDIQRSTLIPLRLPRPTAEALEQAAAGTVTQQASELLSVEILTEARDFTESYGLVDGVDGEGGDECYAGNGVPYPPITGGGCPNGRRKQNQTYPWGLTQIKLPGSEPGVGHRIWIGTLANGACVTKGFSLGDLSATPEWYDGEPFPLIASETPVADPAPNSACVQEEGDEFWQCPDLPTIEYNCEYGESQMLSHPGVGPHNGDWRRPHIYEYNRDTDVITDYTPDGSAAAAAADEVIGFRFCAATPGNEVVFCGGPALEGGDIVLVAFDTTGEGSRFIGSKRYRNYSNVRKGYSYGDPGALYFGVRSKRGDHGKVLRWVGDATPRRNANVRKRRVFQFEEVGSMDGDPRELTLIGPDSEGMFRLAASTTQPSFIAGEASGVWVSPLFGSEGLTAEDLPNWQKVFDFGSYEPDAPALSNTAGGAIVAFNQEGYLYWSSLHVFGYAATIHSSCPFSFCAGEAYAATNSEKLHTMVNRATTLWRGAISEDLSIDPNSVEMLCGEPHLPAWDQQTGDFVDTDTGWTPSFPRPGGGGLCGQGLSQAGNAIVTDEFGFRYEYLMAYSWAGDINHPANPAEQRMCFGTLDLGYSIFGMITRFQWGADLVCKAPGTNTFYLADRGGAGNGLNYGYRIVRPDAADPEGKRFLVGMANGFNLELLQTEPRNLSTWPNQAAQMGWREGWSVRTVRVADE
ncbi:hypothetical protein E4634_16895 [Mangrovimicrobium sediminis]|uniref:Uncharacterized protein n=1 Tax=Mangrovimicrobium sediminis TaxID=2562682 RepID=A0A4Z0LWR9_9GAMM|nr:hypothetical protein [Haliea sp. SAOS-164]TGD71792.1 hypothetical protein E4634_16895 [Haliea sp. SAOS-164]